MADDALQLWWDRNVDLEVFFVTNQADLNLVLRGSRRQLGYLEREFLVHSQLLHSSNLGLVRKGW